MKHEYKIGKLTWRQEELTVKQDNQILKFIGSIAEKNPDVDIKNIFDVAVKYNVLGTLFGIILIPKKNIQYYIWKAGFVLLWLFRIRKGVFTQVPLAKAKNSQIKDIMEDFFLLNKELMKKLSKLNNILGLIIQAAMDPEPGKTNTKMKDLKKNPPKD